MRRRHALAGLALALAACGGGGTTNGGNPLPPPALSLGRSVFGETFRLLLLTGFAPAPPVERTAFNPLASRLAVGDAGGNVRVADGATGTLVFAATLPAPGTRWVGTAHEGFSNGSGPRVTGLVLLAGGTKALAANGYGRVSRFALATGVVEVSQELPVPVVAMDADEPNDRFAVGTDQGGVLEFTISTLQLVRTYRPEDGHQVRFVRYVANGTGLLSALRDYDPGDDVDGGGGGTVADAGLTRWSTATGLRDVRFAGPMGTATAVQDPTTGRIVAGTQSGRGGAWSTAGTPIADDLRLRDGVVPLGSVGGRPLLAAVGPREIRVLGIDDLVQVWAGADLAPTVLAVPRSVSSATLSNVFAVGRQDGAVCVYQYEPTLGADGTPRAIDRTGPVGTALGLTVHWVRELHAHAAAVRELSSSPSGRYLASRDELGEAFLWDFTLLPVVAPGGAPIVVPPAAPILGGAAKCPPSSPIFSFGPGESSLLRVADDGTLTRFDLPGLTNPTPIQVSAGGPPIPVVCALEVVPGQILVGGADGSLRVCDGGGTVLQTLVPAAVAMMTPIPFRFLLRHPDGQRVVVVPEGHSPDLGAPEPVRSWQIAGWLPLAASTQTYEGGRVTPLPGSTLLALGETYERRRLAFLDGTTLAPTAVGSHLAPAFGFGGSTGGVLIGADPRSLRFATAAGASIQSASLPLPFPTPASAFASAPSTSRLFVGTASGAIAELAWD